jgi:hypothetical protein
MANAKIVVKGVVLAIESGYETRAVAFDAALGVAGGTVDRVALQGQQQAVGLEIGTGGGDNPASGGRRAYRDIEASKHSRPPPKMWWRKTRI